MKGSPALRPMKYVMVMPMVVPAKATTISVKKSSLPVKDRNPAKAMVVSPGKGRAINSSRSPKNNTLYP